MTVDTFCLGNLETNAYVVSEENRCWIFDCPGEPGALVKFLLKKRWEPQGVYLTHAHVDHMAGLTEFRESFPRVEVWQHSLETSWLTDPQANLSALMGASVTALPAEHTLEDKQELSLGSRFVQVLHVPGHSPGSVAFWFRDEAEVISGDVLFRSGVGRWDFPGCNVEHLRRSLDRLCELPGETKVRPGHGGSTTIARERMSNPYVRGEEAWS